jgi:hypothetical protein
VKEGENAERVVSPLGALKAFLSWELKDLQMLYRTGFDLLQASTTIRAELEGSRRCSTLGLTVDGYAPVCALARLLIRAGYEPNHTLEVFRGTTLCFRVPLAVAARLTVEGGPDGVLRFRQYHPPSWEVGPPVTPTGLRAIQHLTPPGTMPYGGEP